MMVCASPVAFVSSPLIRKKMIFFFRFLMFPEHESLILKGLGGNEEHGENGRKLDHIFVTK